MSAVPPRRPLDHGRNAWRDRGKPRKYRTDETCKDKRRYPDEMSIRAVGAVELEERKAKRLWCYRCRHCTGWHLTSKDQGPRWEIRRCLW
jgi:hypothetical protein